MNVKLFFKLSGIITGIALLVFIISGIIIIATGLFSSGDVNVLVLATDKGQLLTDTVMVANMNTHTEKINLLSLPRDTRIQLESGKNVKLNSVYQLDSEKERPKKVVSVVEDLLDIKIDHYVIMYPDGFKNIIDALGGVEFNVPQDMNYDDPDQGLHIHLKKGLQHLDGDKAEQYVRFRSGYQNADIGRISAQQEFLKALMEQKLNAGIIAKLPSLYSTLNKDFDSDIKLQDAVKIAKTAFGFKTAELNAYTLPSYPKYINGASYVIINEEETKKLIDSVFKATTPSASAEAE